MSLSAFPRVQYKQLPKPSHNSKGRQSDNTVYFLVSPSLIIRYHLSTPSSLHIQNIPSQFNFQLKLPPCCLPDEIQINGNNLTPDEAEAQINKERARKQMQIHV